MRSVQKIFCIVCIGLLVFPWSSVSAATISGQGYETFSQYYKDDITFINNNDSRHLLPLVIAKRTSDENDGRLVYELLGDTLSAVITTDPSGEIIESCVITLTAPSGMEYGNALYNDFAISGYHSYALLMAMHTDTDPARRYDLVTDVVQGMSETDGAYTRQLGVYTLTCTRLDNVATLSFQNNRAQTASAPEDGETLPSETGGDSDGTSVPSEDEAAGML